MLCFDAKSHTSTNIVRADEYGRICKTGSPPKLSCKGCRCISIRCGAGRIRKNLLVGVNERRSRFQLFCLQSVYEEASFALLSLVKGKRRQTDAKPWEERNNSREAKLKEIVCPMTVEGIRLKEMSVALRSLTGNSLRFSNRNLTFKSRLLRATARLRVRVTFTG